MDDSFDRSQRAVSEVQLGLRSAHEHSGSVIGRGGGAGGTRRRRGHVAAVITDGAGEGDGEPEGHPTDRRLTDNLPFLDTPPQNGTLLFARLAGVSMVEYGPYGNAPSTGWLGSYKDSRSKIATYFSRTHHYIQSLLDSYWAIVYDTKLVPAADGGKSCHRILMELLEHALR